MTATTRKTKPVSTTWFRKVVTGSSPLLLLVVCVSLAEAIPDRIFDCDFRHIDGGRVKDLSGKGRDGTLVGGASLVPDAHGPVLSVNGKGQYVRVNGFSSFQLGRGFTVTAVARFDEPWSKEREPDCYDGIASSSKSSFVFTRGFGGRLYFNAMKDSKGLARVLGESPPTGRYVHAAVTVQRMEDADQGFDGYLIQFFLNGEPAGGAAINGLRFAEFGDALLIGTAFSGKTSPWAFKGRIASVRLYDRALTEGEIVADAKESPYVKDIKGPVTLSAELQRRFETVAARATEPEAGWLVDVVGRVARDQRFAELADNLVALTEKMTSQSAQQPLAWWRAQGRGIRVIEGEQLLVALAEDKSHCELAGVYDRKQKRDLLGALPPLWSVVYAKPKGEEITLESDKASSRLVAGPAREGATVRFGIEWKTDSPPLVLQSAMEITGRRLMMNLSLTNRSPEVVVLQVVFPQLAFKRLERGRDVSVEPHGFGGCRRDPVRQNAAYSGRYPSRWATMQFGAYYDDEGGVYFAAEDPEAQVKEFTIRGKGGQLMTSWRWFAGNDGKGGNHFAITGKAAVETFEGDWFDAAQIYKRWLAASAPWFPKLGRPDTPDWYKKMTMWLYAGRDVKPYLELQQYLELPLGLHDYGWSDWGDSGKRFPHYVARAGYREQVASWKAQGFRVKPYMDYYLWSQTDGRDGSDFEYTKIGLPSAAKKRDGTIAAAQKYGEYGDIATVMCPAAAPFQEKIRKILSDMADLGVDAIYLDQMAAALPYVCFDPNHGHAPGSGTNWLRDGYWKYLSEFRKTLKAAHPQLAFDTECMAEPYAHLVDGFLAYSSINPLPGSEKLPIHPAIYGGRVQYTGKLCPIPKGDERPFFAKIGEALVQGETLYRGRPSDILASDRRKRFVKQMAHTRQALLPYFNEGEMARPLRFESLPTFTSDWGYKGRVNMITCPAIVHAVWKRSDSLALVFVNVTDREVATVVSFDGARYGLAASKLSLLRCDGSSRPSETVALRFQSPMRLPPHTPEVWILNWGQNGTEPVVATSVSETMRRVRSTEPARTTKERESPR